MKDDKIPFLQSLQALAPHLNATAKKELDALVELTTLFRAASVAELKTALVKQRKAFAKTPEGFAAEALKVVDEGASFIGGCCGSSPAFVAAVRAALDAR